MKQVTSEEFREMYASGMEIKDMAKELGVSRVTIHSWASKLGITGRRKPLIKDAG